MADPFLTVTGLTRRFDVSKPWLNRVLEREDRQFLTATADVSFSINKGETFALVGKSGSGKSTIAKMIVGLLTPSAGQIAIEGQGIDPADPIAMRALRRRMQMISKTLSPASIPAGAWAISSPNRSARWA